MGGVVGVFMDGIQLNQVGEMMANHGGRVFEHAVRLGCKPSDLLDFSANINPLGPPPSVVQAMQNALTEVQFYPDASHRRLKEVLGAHLGLESDAAVFCGNGASEVLDLAVRHTMPTRMVVFEPAFSEYEAVARRNRVPLIRALLGHDMDLLASLSRVELAVGDLVVCNNPHNPTGHRWPRHVMETLLMYAKDCGASVIIDESFLNFCPDWHQVSVIPLIRDFLGCVVVQSATKLYSIPGVRFGFGVASPKWVADLERWRDGWTVNHVAQRAAEAAYQDEAFVMSTWDWLKKEHPRINQTWGQHPQVRLLAQLSVNFFCVRLDATPTQVGQLASDLYQQGILVRDCKSYIGLDGQVWRMAIRSTAENATLWQAFSHFANLHF